MAEVVNNWNFINYPKKFVRKSKEFEIVLILFIALFKSLIFVHISNTKFFYVKKLKFNDMYRQILHNC